MEILKSRYGVDRVIEKIDHETFRVLGESAFSRISDNGDGSVTMFDFEGGPTFYVGNKIKYGGLNWEILSIKSSNDKQLSSCILKVKPIF